ncbi:hypothetical protein SSTU70S_03256 [Stutzerimonas stutzeri]
MQPSVPTFNQRRVLEEFVVARGLAGVEFIEEVGGGLNFKRKKFLALMDEVGRGEIKALILAHRDRLTRFGYEWFEHYAHGMAARFWCWTRSACRPSRRWCKT